VATAARGGLRHLSSGPGPRNDGLRPRGYGRARARAHGEARVGIRSWMGSPGRTLFRGKLESQDGHRHPLW
jgi:hypothetical protein